jgi:acetyl esterase
MPLDSQAEIWLKELKESGAPALNEMSVPDARTTYAAVVEQCGLAAEPVANIIDQTIPGPHGEIPIRIYRPEATGALPILVYYHGGGWVIGNLDVVHSTCTVLTNRAHAVVISVDYRLAPEHPFPAPVDDSIAALEWVHANAAQLSIDPERIAVGGDSAGGNLAAVVALHARDHGPKLVHQLLIYPVTDFLRETDSFRENGQGYFLTSDLMHWFGDHYAADPQDWRASPLRAESLSGVAPAHVITAEFDPLRDEGEMYAARLTEAGVDVTLERYDGQLHAFTANLAGIMDHGKASIEAAGSHLRQVFRAGWQPRMWL